MTQLTNKVQQKCPTNDRCATWCNASTACLKVALAKNHNVITIVFMYHSNFKYDEVNDCHFITISITKFVKIKRHAEKSQLPKTIRTVM